MKTSIATVLFAVVLAWSGAQAQTRPHTPFVEKAFTADRSRQLKVALNEKLWILYDLPQCQLYEAWAGGTAGGKLITANYSWFNQEAHFPSWFAPDGTQYFKVDVGEYFATWTKPADIDTYYKKWTPHVRNYHAWVVQNAGQAVVSQTKNRGYSVAGNIFKLNFSLILADGREIAVTETPEYSAAGGKTNLVRKLAFTGIPAGYSAILNLPAGGNWAVTGSGAMQGATLVQSADGESTLTGSW